MRILSIKKPPNILRGSSGVVSPGFEPGLTGPKPVVLPLHHETIKTKNKPPSFKEVKSLSHQDSNPD